MEVSASTVRHSDLKRDDDAIIKRLNQTEDRSKLEAGPRETPAEAHRNAMKRAEAAIGRYLDAKA